MDWPFMSESQMRVTVVTVWVITTELPASTLLLGPPMRGIGRSSSLILMRGQVMSPEHKSQTYRLRSLIGLLTLGGIGLVLSVGARAANSDGWYTPDQAAHGHIVFNSYCAQCHRPDLTGALGPALIGNAFLEAWLNKPLGDLYEFEHTQMPANNPGSVPADKLWTITAFLLQKNGFPAGSTPLGEQAAGRTLAKAQ